MFHVALGAVALGAVAFGAALAMRRAVHVVPAERRGRAVPRFKALLEHFPVKWIRFTIENAAQYKARADSAKAETALEHFPVKWIRFFGIRPVLFCQAALRAPCGYRLARTEVVCERHAGRKGIFFVARRSKIDCLRAARTDDVPSRSTPNG